MLDTIKKGTACRTFGAVIAVEALMIDPFGKLNNALRNLPTP
jgi:hypothetical protein